VQVAEVCVQCERVVRQDDARVLLAAPELDTLLDTVHAQQQQFAHLAPDQLTLDPAVPVTFTKDNRVHIGPKVSWLKKRPFLLRYYDLVAEKI
jgi:tripartite motif-containing protein 23